MMVALGLVGFTAGAPLPAPIPPKEPEVPLELRKAQLKAALAVYTRQSEDYNAGRGGTGSDRIEWARRVLDARLALAGGRDERIAACRSYVDEMKAFEKVCKSKVDAGTASAGDLKVAEYWRIEAEILLFKAEAK
jgi:hypothetical protein